MYCSKNVGGFLWTGIDLMELANPIVNDGVVPTDLDVSYIVNS